MFYSSQHVNLSFPWSGLSLSILFLLQFKRFIFFTFPFWYFIVSVKKCNQILLILLILYLATLLNSFISSNSFYLESLGFSIYIIMSTVYNDNFTSTLPISIPFIFLVWLLWLRIPILCWRDAMRVGILVFFQILAGRDSDSHHWVIWVCHK